MSKIIESLLYLKVLFVKFKKRINLLANIILFLVSLASVSLLVIVLGYTITGDVQSDVVDTSIVFLFIFFIGATVRYIFNFKEVVKEKLLLFDILTYLLLFGVLSVTSFFSEEIQEQFRFLHFLSNRYLIFTLLTTLSVINISKFVFRSLNSKINPSLLFIYSFLLIILIGTGLLMLPNSTNYGIHFIDALFTATTCVCVTGLCTVDVATTFTLTGQIIILTLIQVGGIGVMTFTSFFALSFIGNSSFGGRILLKDLLDEENLGNIFKTIGNILMVTFIIEGLGAYLIWDSIHGEIGASLDKEMYTSVFHSISAFCNAGISTFEGNLTNSMVVTNYELHCWIGILIIFGGLGFPIVFNYMKLLKHFVVNCTQIVLRKQERYVHQPRIINIHSRIVVISTIVLLISGTILIYLAENNRLFADMSLAGKLTNSFFGAVTPRTAGFNTVDMTHFAQPTLFIILILMMIGAAPMSTGGGMKVSAVYITLLSVIGTARGKQQVEMCRREIASSTIRKAMSVVILYFIWVLVATSILSYTEGNVRNLTLLFEVVSALSTVGLSLNFSPELSIPGKYIIVLSMFVGRIGVLTFFSGILKRSKPINFRYSETGLTIG